MKADDIFARESGESCRVNICKIRYSTRYPAICLPPLVDESNLHRRLNRTWRTINRELNITFNKSGRGLTPIRNLHRWKLTTRSVPDALLNIATLEITLCHYRVSMYITFSSTCALQSLNLFNLQLS